MTAIRLALLAIVSLCIYLATLTVFDPVEKRAKVEAQAAGLYGCRLYGAVPRGQRNCGPTGYCPTYVYTYHCANARTMEFTQ